MIEQLQIDTDATDNDSAVLPEGQRPEGKTAEFASTVNQTNPPDPQVNTKRKRRTYTASYKLKMLEAYEACPSASVRGELLRREGLYYARISTWRKERETGKLGSGANQSKATVSHAKTSKLVRENAQLKKKLSQAEAVIDLQKKVSELLGQHILSPEMEESN